MYLYALSHDEDHPDDIRIGQLIYVARIPLETRAFVVELTVETWSPVLQWARELADPRFERSLLPADPPDVSLCEYCPYRRRCGETDHDVVDAPVEGLAPATSTPRASRSVPHSPRRRRSHPDLAREHPVAPWHCQRCGRTYQWAADAIDWDDTDDVDPAPDCPNCDTGPLDDPQPADQ